VTTAEQWACAEAAAADGAIVTVEFSELYDCLMCSEPAAGMCLGGYTDPDDCMG
jgi:hypothetical protein